MRGAEEVTRRTSDVSGTPNSVKRRTFEELFGVEGTTTARWTGVLDTTNGETINEWEPGHYLRTRRKKDTLPLLLMSGISNIPGSLQIVPD